MKTLKSLALTFALTLAAPSFAKVIQIIHTNDLHSYFQGTRGGIGGYAQLKVEIDKLRAEALARGIPTIHLDGGDFGEGSSFYFSNHGVDSLRALDLLGVDVTVLGNHDFILGGKQLRNQMRDAKLKATMLSANLKGKTLMGLKSMVKDYVDYDFDGIKVRIFGLTTNEIHYMYPLRPLGWISKPHKVGMKQAEKAKKAGVDFLIALTHIGLEHDITLVNKSRSIDLVVGGHSHTRLGKPELVKNLEGKLIPILQAGAHSGYVGSMIVDLKGNREAELVEYRMIDIMKDMPKDKTLSAFADQAYKNRENYFGGRKWDEVIGTSEIPLSGNFNGRDIASRTCWSRHLARLTREAGKTELGLQFDVFQGELIPAGTITFGDIVDNFPHFRRWGDQGWNVARARVSGFLLKQILSAMANSEVALQVMIDGVTVKDRARNMEIQYNPEIHTPEMAEVNGEELQNLRYYSIALPSEVPYGIEKLANVFGRVILGQLQYLDNTNYWPLIEGYIKKNSPLRCLEN